MRASTSAASIVHRLRRFARCERGAVMPLFLVSAAVIFGASLGGLDLARHASATTRLQNALDGAALAMGRLASSEQDTSVLLGEARRYFEANFPADYQGSGIDAGRLSLSTNDSGRVLTLSVDGSLPLLSTGFLDVSAAALRAKSTVALERNPNLEVVFSKDTNSFDGLGELFFASALRKLGQALLTNQDNSVYIGTVPYSDVVNVGNGEKQQAWVARWLEHDTTNKSQPGAKNYHRNYWSGCIAEPTPWVRPDLGNIRPLTPAARFIPLSVRIQTSLHEKLQKKDKGWQLNTSQFQKNEYVTQYVEQPISLIPVASGADRYFWSNFTRGPGNSGKSEFDIYSLHEPLNCLTAAQVHFLDNTVDALDALETMADIPPQDYLKSLPPAGLLWSWRMLAPAWRQGNGWDTSALPQDGAAPARAIVLITPGDITSWEWLGFTNQYNILRPIWKSGSTNAFQFQMTYHTDTCVGDPNNNDGDLEKCKKGGRYVRTHQHNAALSSQDNEWQYPVSSLAMTNPFGTPNALDFNGWPSVAEYLEATCNAIKNDGISLFVLSPRALNWTGVFGNRDRFLRCASDSRIYTMTQMEALKQALLNLRSESSTLRLVPSS